MQVSKIRPNADTVFRHSCQMGIFDSRAETVVVPMQRHWGQLLVIARQHPMERLSDGGEALNMPLLVSHVSVPGVLSKQTDLCCTLISFDC